MKKHFASAHEEIKLFQCGVCDYKCSDKGNMKRHIASLHKENINLSVKFE